MKTTIYVIKGQQNYGKTTTCWALLNLLKPHVQCYNYWKTSSDYSVVWDSTRSMYIIPNGNNPGIPADFTVVVTLSNGLRVAIISAGDEADWLRTRICEILGMGVRTIVCCTRSKNTSGSTLKMLKDEFEVGDNFFYTLAKEKDTLEQQKNAKAIFCKLV